jgi:hypothetical protein
MMKRALATYTRGGRRIVEHVAMVARSEKVMMDAAYKHVLRMKDNGAAYAIMIQPDAPKANTVYTILKESV